jgi:lysophospholipase L1-like esterase
MRKLRTAAVAALLLSCAGCTPLLFTIGDSQTSIAQQTIQTALQPIDRANLVQGHSGCGLYVDRACDPAYNLQADIAHRISLGVPKYVVVELGTNDAYWQQNAELIANYASKVAEFVSWWPASVHIFWANVPYMPCCPFFDANVDAVNAGIDQVASTNPSVTVVDLHTAFLDHVTDWFESDGIHYNAAGQQVFADLVCSAVAGWDNGPNETCPPFPTTTTSTTTTSVPDTTTSVPDTTTSVPDDTTTSVPDTTTSVPDDTTTSVPDTTTSVPDTTTSVPDTTTSVPDTTTSAADMTSRWLIYRF